MVLLLKIVQIQNGRRSLGLYIIFALIKKQVAKRYGYNNDWFYIATYHPHGGSQTALQSIITPADQLIPYIEMLSLQTFTSKCFQRSLSQVPITPG